MVRVCVYVAAVLLSCALCTAFTTRLIQDEYIITLQKDRVRTDDQQDALVELLENHYNINLIKAFRFNDLRLLYVSGKEENINVVKNLADIKRAEQNAYAQGAQSCNTVPTPETWGLDRVDQRETLPYTSPYEESASYTYSSNIGQGVTAYICDSGIEIDHPDFGGRATWGYTSIGMDGDADLNGHGTHCAGTVGSNSFGIAPGVDLVAVKVLLADNSGPWASIIDGLEWIVADHQRRIAENGGVMVKSVVNFSIGGGTYNAVDDAVREVIQAGITIAISAMNENEDACTFSPARVPEALTIGASDVEDDSATFTNYGSCVDLFGPGVTIKSTYPGQTTSFMSGTSMATPHVIGVAARYVSSLATAPTPAQVADYLISNATPDELGWSRPAHGSESPNLLLFADCGL